MDQEVERGKVSCEELLSEAITTIRQGEETLIRLMAMIARLEQSLTTKLNPPRRYQTPYEAIILDALRDAGQRLTFTPLRAAIAATGHHPDDSTIKRHIKRLILDGKIDNRSDVQPAGYGLVSDPQVSAEPQPAPAEKQARGAREGIDFGVAILMLLKETGHRMDFPALRAGLAKMGCRVGDVTLKRHLATLIEEKKIDHRPEAHPPGYGILESE